MKEIRTEITINAPADRVWSILTDFSRFEAWNPLIRRIDGEVAAGKRLKIRIELPSGMAMSLKPVITRLTPLRELRWIGRLLVVGLFDGEHIFEIESLEDKTVKFVHRECFRGILVPLVWNYMEKSIRQGYHEMNAALKKRSEEAPKGDRT